MKPGGPGDKIAGKVRSLTDDGVFVGIEDGVDGMVHESDLSWTVRVNNPSDLFPKGDDVEAIILSINHDEKKVSLGVKQLWDEPWPGMMGELPMGRVVDEATVLTIVDYGVFIRLREGVEALISMVARHAVEPQEVFVAGVSNGGMMTFRLACELSETIAAAAAVIALMPRNGVEACRPAGPVPMMIVAGTEDGLVPFEGPMRMSAPPACSCARASDRGGLDVPGEPVALGSSSDDRSQGR